MQFQTLFAIAALAAVQVNAETIRFYGSRSCDGAPIQEQQVSCNSCFDPPGDFWAVQFSGVDAGQRVSIHNQDNCTPGSSVGQWYGSLCAHAGHTALRSAWVACKGQRDFSGLNGTSTNDGERPTTTITVED